MKNVRQLLTVDDLIRLPQRVAFVPNLPAAFLARNAAQAAGNPRLLLQSVARRRLAAVRTVGADLAAKISDLLLQRDILEPKPGILHPQFRNLTPRRGKLGPRLEKLHARRAKLLPYFGKLSPESFDYRLEVGGLCHPDLDSYPRRRRNRLQRPDTKISATVPFRTHQSWVVGSYE